VAFVPGEEAAELTGVGGALIDAAEASVDGAAPTGEAEALALVAVING
jgi:hypothetical protein